jgi:hypothetical protein
MVYEKAGDHYVGRILAGLPVLSVRFAASEPNFWIRNPMIQMHELSKQSLIRR